jgi:thioredoxin-related protein
MLGTLIWYGSEPEPPAVQSTPLPERVAWTDFGQGLQKASAAGKPLMVAFVTGWCGYCRKMDRVTWKDPDVLDELAQLVAVRVNAEESVERNGYRGVDIAGRFSVGTYPTVLLLDSSGRELSRAVGYKDPREFLRWLRGR